ncbi:uncharacterized protein SAPINGB_P001335 [Magnusiomyces paraingens]|uniref:HIT-type domain-containing protein n=1 Tax=Magnusiomyces paraingens TaxID=2606893 RepID=A0A5E8B576_9ASCO|nr:uncharacterized protein SAPINGB_P001335 [Saprochaete ingens]VVT46683.1 unnamed protein product [Saprochaete ingens]
MTSKQTSGGIKCGVCHAVPPKYKCPRCALPYCSLVCFKAHKTQGCGDFSSNSNSSNDKDLKSSKEEGDRNSSTEFSKTTEPLLEGEAGHGLPPPPPPLSAPESTSLQQQEQQEQQQKLVEDGLPIDERFEAVIRDEQIQALLRYDALRFHLKNLFSLQTDAKHAGENTAEGRRAVALRKLTELRVGGLEANELVEEFCERVMAILEGQEP